MADTATGKRQRHDITRLHVVEGLPPIVNEVGDATLWAVWKLVPQLLAKVLKVGAVGEVSEFVTTDCNHVVAEHRVLEIGVPPGVDPPDVGIDASIVCPMCDDFCRRRE